MAPAARGEGKWVWRDRWSGWPPAVETTTYRSAPGVTAYLALIDPTRVVITARPGTGEPPLGAARSGQVPAADRSQLLATFNGGFKWQAAPGGLITNGREYAPLQRGLATLSVSWDHHANVSTWDGDSTAPWIRSSRQNLRLLVAGGRPVASAGDLSAWGATIGPSAVWRTGVGITRAGDLVYAAAPQQTPLSLAQILIHAGAVRAMQLDINPLWPTFDLYNAPGANVPTAFVPNPNEPLNRYLTPDTRDFFTITLPRR
jgi:hypothetical protein